MGSDDQRDLRVHIYADAAQVWVMLREPSKVAQWHGWEYEDLDDEIKQIYFTDATEDEKHSVLTVNGKDRFLMEPVSDGTQVTLERAPRDSSTTEEDYDVVTEGWITFLQQLRFALERHPKANRTTIFFSGTPLSSRPIAEQLGLTGLPEPGDEYSVHAATREDLSGKVWFRSEHQLGLTVNHYADHGRGLLILADTPPTKDRPDGGAMVIASTYELGAKDLNAIRSHWDSWRQQNLSDSEPLL